MWNGIDKRKFPRIHCNCIIRITKKGSDKTIATRTENIGEGGVCVVLAEDLGLFHGVSLELDMEDGITSNIKCNATIVWVVKKRKPDEMSATQQYDTGIEFVDIDDSGKERILKTVEDTLKTR